MNYALKRKMDAFLEVCDTFDENLNLTEKFGDISLRNVAKLCFLQFLMYLSASDGRIKQSEADFLGDYLDFNGLTPDALLKSIRENNIYSTEFENEVPISVTTIIKLDNIFYQRNPDAFDFDLPNCMLEIFEELGNEFIKCDGSISESEKADLNIYLKTLRDYVRKNSDRPLASFDSTVNIDGNEVPISISITDIHFRE